MKPSDESCKLCRFAGEKQYFNDYPCHRRAPMVRTVASSQDIRMHVPTFPIMTGDDWCGEFQAETAGGTDRQADEICECGFARGSFGCDDSHRILAEITVTPERVQISAESEHVAHDDWFCEQHPWEVMGHDGCDGAGMLDCARWPMAQHIIRMRDQEIRELHQQYGFLAKHALAESGEMTGVAPYDRCPKCTAHMPVGQTCGGKDCGLRREK